MPRSVRLAAERGVDAGFPGSVQALIAAGLHTLSHKELVRPTCTSSMEGEAEYVFWHALAPDVACPRAAHPPGDVLPNQSVARRARWLRAEVLHGWQRAAGPGYLYEIYSKPVAKVLISIPDDLLERIDREAERRGATRSGFLQHAAQRELGWPDPSVFDAALERGRTALGRAGAFESAELIRAERDARAARDRRR
jgi:hypothetical protein